jgi:outer membrane protein assembly factor BamE (lipoprotein component of BamABCDE complex)
MLEALGARRILVILTVTMALGVTVACTPRVDIRGNRPDLERVAEITPGEHSRELVEEILGSPSIKSSFGQETWFYVSSKTETVVFLEPEVKERLVLSIRFDDEGVVKFINQLGLEDGHKVELVERISPTVGNELTLMDQIFGNFGRFSVKQ